jgi:hypothetical protein
MVTAALTCAALCLVLLIPASALAAPDPLTISSAPTTTSGAGSCAFVATAAGQNVNTDDLEQCLATGNTSVTDPTGDGGAIEVESPITETPCVAHILTLDEEVGTVAIDAPINLDICNVFIETGGSVTQTAAITAAGLSVNAGQSVTLNASGGNAIETVEGSAGDSSAGGTLLLDTSGALTVDPFSDPGGDVTIQSQGSVSLQGETDVSGDVVIDAPQSGSSVTEESGSSLTAQSLNVTAGNDVTLDSSGNQFGAAPSTAVVDASSGTLSLDDDVSGLELDGINANTGIDVTNTGSITSESQLQDASADDSLTSQNGSVSETPGAAAGAEQLTVTGTSVSLDANNYVQALDASATSGDVDAYLHEPGATLGNISASGGTVDIANNDGGSLEVAGTISANSITLNADGFSAAGGAAFAAPSISLSDTDSIDDWAVNASTITPGSSAAIAYSGASSLSIDGGALFNVVPSSATTMTLSGGSPTPNATLDYNAEGGTVSGSDTPPSGTIDNSEYKPVTYSSMAAVNVTGAAAPPPTNTTPTNTTPTNTTPTTPPPTATTTTPSAPTCALRASSSKVTLPKRVHGKLKGKATVSLVASCDAAVSATLVGRITVLRKPAHGKAKSKGYGVGLVHVALAANTSKKIVLNVPPAVVTALARKGDKLSAGFTLADPGHGDDVLKTVTIAHLT